MPALPAWPSGSGGQSVGFGLAGVAETGRRVGCGVACDAAWRPCRLCRRGRLVRARRGYALPSRVWRKLVDVSDAASLAMPLGGHAGFAGVAVWFGRAERRVWLGGCGGNW